MFNDDKKDESEEDEEEDQENSKKDASPKRLEFYPWKIL